MTSARHRAPAMARHGRRAATPVRSTYISPASMRTAPVKAAADSSLRKLVITSSAVVAAAGLSMTMVVPANASTLQGSAKSGLSTNASAATVTPAFLRDTQSYTVPQATAAASLAASVTRDGYTATSPALLAAREAALASARAAVAGKAAAIEAILATPVTVVGYSKSATGATAGDDDVTSVNGGGVITTTSGTVADRVSAATLAAGSATGNEIVASAVQYVGVVPYVHGGATPTGGFDCSGLVQYVYAKFGIAVPHDVDGIAALGTEITADALQPGDLVVYPHQHIGIYIGDGYMVDAPNVGRDVEVQSVWGSPVFVHIVGA